MGFWNKVTAHPAYDNFWQAQAMDKILAARPITVPMLLVGSLWDAEDIYGYNAVWKALKPKDTKATWCACRSGPGITARASTKAVLGAVKFGQDTSANGGGTMCWRRSWRII